VDEILLDGTLEQENFLFIDCRIDAHNFLPMEVGLFVRLYWVPNAKTLQYYVIFLFLYP